MKTLVSVQERDGWWKTAIVDADSGASVSARVPAPLNYEAGRSLADLLQTFTEVVVEHLDGGDAL